MLTASGRLSPPAVRCLRTSVSSRPLSQTIGQQSRSFSFFLLISNLQRVKYLVHASAAGLLLARPIKDRKGFGRTVKSCKIKWEKFVEFSF